MGPSSTTMNGAAGAFNLNALAQSDSPDKIRSNVKAL
jgi:hypothetical protein